MRYIIGLCALAIILVIAFTALDPATQQRRQTAAYVERERLALRLEQERRTAEILAPITIVASAAWQLLPLVIIGALGALAFDAYRGRRQVVKYAGLPVSRRVVEADPDLTRATIYGHQHAQIERARNVGTPERLSVNYGPKLATTHTPAPLALVDQVEHLLTSDVPTFAQLLATHEIGPHKPLVLGYDMDTGAPLRGTLQTVSTGAIAGLSGGGKSTTTRGLFGQCALQGVRFVLGDPHGAAGGEAGQRTLAQTLAPLQRSFLCDVAIDRRAILAAVQLVGSELERRKRGAPQPYPILLALDEFSNLMRPDDDVARSVAAVLESVATEGNKFGVFAWVLGHQWQATRSGGTELRSVLQSAYLHRMRPDTARAVTGLRSADVPDIARLQPGEAYFFSSSGRLQRVRIPNTTSADLEVVAQRFEVVAHSSGTRADVVLSADETRIIELFRAGNDTAAIARIIDPKATTGGRMQQRSAEVQAVLRKVL
jgi:hypothetical protein